MADMNRFIDYVNELMRKENVTKARMARDIGVDKNSLGNYLLKHTGMPMQIGINIAEYLQIDISKVCGIETKETLTRTEKELIQEIRKSDSKRESLTTRLLEVAKLFHS